MSGTRRARPLLAGGMPARLLSERPLRAPARCRVLRPARLRSRSTDVRRRNVLLGILGRAPCVPAGAVALGAALIFGGACSGRGATRGRDCQIVIRGPTQEVGFDAQVTLEAEELCDGKPSRAPIVWSTPLQASAAG